MRRLAFVPVLALSLLGVSLAGDVAKDKKALQGKWTMVELIEGGNKSEKQSVEVVFRGDDIMVIDDGKELVSGTYKLDAAKKPKTVEVMFAKGDQKKTMKGVYEIDGDTLRICHFEGPKGETDYPAKVEANKDT